MAGGEGAKERRRLKRLAAQEAKAKSAEPQENSKSVTSAKEGIVSSGKKQYDQNPSTSRRSSNGGHKNSKKNDRRNTNGKKAKKTKIKKPKHLKRKLEQASNENNEARQLIEREIEDFESKKKFYSRKKINGKRQKTSSDDKSRKHEIGNDADKVSRLNKINFGESDGPLKNDRSPNKPVVIEDDVRRIQEHSEMPILHQSNRDHSDESIENMIDADAKDANGTLVSQVAEDSKESISSDDNTSSSKESNNGSRGSFGHDSNDMSDSSSDDSDDDDEPVQRRQRGRRRRGRQDTAKKIEEKEALEISTAAVASREHKNETIIDAGKKRYCIGRKPVTDFVIGQSHSGKVVYVKPFGVFFDIGCHSDAFCHVSRLSDDYVESPQTLFKEGDEVPKLRIVEIDRSQKRITVSLQSEARINDERRSIEDRKLRKEKRQQKSKKTSGSARIEGAKDNDLPNARVDRQPDPTIKEATSVTPIENLDPSKMTPAELKRARKLARRAERRAQAAKEVQ